jgi:type I restriction enzyme S subunit
MGDRSTVGDYVTLQRGTTYKGTLVGKPGPALLGLGSLQPGGGFRDGDYKTYGGECPPKLMLFPGDLFVSLKGATKDGEMIGSVARVPPTVSSGRLTQDTVKLEFHSWDQETANFLYWVLRTPQYRAYCAGRATGSAVVALSRDDFLAYPVPAITPTRMRIVEVLGALDDKIELNRRMNATLEAMARALFQSWFVDFDPVRLRLSYGGQARATKDNPAGLPAEALAKAGLDPATAALFPEHLEHSPLGDIPQGWTVGTLGDIGTNPRRGVQPGEIAPNTPYVALEHMPRRCIALGDWNSSADVASGKFAFKKGEILFGKLRPYFHKVGVAPVDGVCSTDILVLAPMSHEWFGFLLGHASSDELVQFTDFASTGTKMPRTNWGDISSFKVVVPPKAVAAAFTRVVEPMTDRIIANLHQSRTLAALRDTLLPKLLRGELRVPAESES